MRRQEGFADDTFLDSEMIEAAIAAAERGYCQHAQDILCWLMLLPDSSPRHDASLCDIA